MAIACLWLILNFSNYRASSSVAITIPDPAAPGLQTISVRPKPQPINSKILKQSLDTNNFVEAIAQVELGWQYQYENYYQGKLKSQYFNLPEIRQQLASINKSSKSNSALLYAIPTPDALHLILVTATGDTIHKTVKAANAKTFPVTANSLRLNIVNPQTTSAEYLPPAQQLDNWLIQPIAAALKANKIDTILFCLGTGLRGLPLAALHDGRRFLVERYNFAIIPAFNLLETKLTALKGLQVLAMGADKFTDNTNLPAVPLELATITQSGFWQGNVF